MKSLKNFFGKVLGILIITSSCFLILQSCKNDKKESQSESLEVDKDVIEITTENMEFQMPDTISSGWNTFRYKNLSSQTHFFLVDKYPEGKTSKDAKSHVIPVFDNAMALIMDGKTDEGYAEFADLPEWFGEVVFVGGSGLLSPKQTGETTFHIKPGHYVIECYVKMSNGMFHTSMGMIKDLVVTKTNSDKDEPDADILINISSKEGIVFNDSISSGQHTFSVYYKDQIVHENFVGHDVNLAKFEEDANLDELENWMNWAVPEGLRDPAPKGITFIGGINDLPEGHKGYFTADLKAGNYVLISEVPKARSKNMLKKFAVSE